MDNLNPSQKIKIITSYFDYNQKIIAYEIAKDKYEFRQKFFGGGFIGFSRIKLIDTISINTEFTGYTDSEDPDFKTQLENNIIEYLKDLPYETVYSVLPILRWKDEDGKGKSLSLTDSFKIVNTQTFI
jgi:hypothetical protein